MTHDTIIQATIEFTGPNTFFGKTAKLVQSDSSDDERSHLQKVLVTIMYVLVGLSVVLCTLNVLYLLSRGENVKESLSFTIVLLVASIPLAIEIVTTTTLAIGSKALAKHGAIVTKLSAIEDLAGMSILCSDKTGTLTLNQMVLFHGDDDHSTLPIYDKNATSSTVLLHAALACKWNEPPRDAVDRLVLGGNVESGTNTPVLNKQELQKFEQLNYVPFDPTMKRTESTIRNKETGEEYKVSKGAPHIILDLLPKTEAANAVRQQVERDVAKYGERGIRSLAVARTTNVDDEWTVIGLLTFLDPPRADTKETIRHTREHGVQVKMITGKIVEKIRT
jgi:H+-transporting ATPase